MSDPATMPQGLGDEQKAHVARRDGPVNGRVVATRPSLFRKAGDKQENRGSLERCLHEVDPDPVDFLIDDLPV